MLLRDTVMGSVVAGICVGRAGRRASYYVFKLCLVLLLYISEIYIRLVYAAHIRCIYVRISRLNSQRNPACMWIWPRSDFLFKTEMRNTSLLIPLEKLQIKSPLSFKKVVSCRHTIEGKSSFLWSQILCNGWRGGTGGLPEAWPGAGGAAGPCQQRLMH